MVSQVESLGVWAHGMKFMRSGGNRLSTEACGVGAGYPCGTERQTEDRGKEIGDGSPRCGSFGSYTPVTNPARPSFAGVSVPSPKLKSWSKIAESIAFETLESLGQVVSSLGGRRRRQVSVGNAPGNPLIYGPLGLLASSSPLGTLAVLRTFRSTVCYCATASIVF